MTSFPTSFSKGRSVVTMLHYFVSFVRLQYYEYYRLTSYEFTSTVCLNTAKHLKTAEHHKKLKQESCAIAKMTARCVLYKWIE